MSDSFRPAGRTRPPRQRVTTTQRQTLLAEMDRSLDVALTLALSPAGFGKTTLMAQWFERLRRRDDIAVAWLTLDEDDREVTRFLANFGLALEAAGVAIDPGATTQALSVSEAEHRRAALLAALNRSAKSTVIIFDDYHRARSPGTDAALEQIIRFADSRVHIVISARDRPNLRIADLEAQGMVAYIDAPALALTLGEAAEIFQGEIGAEELAALHERTEGWAVALQLAKLWLDRDRGRGREIQLFTGRTEEIGRYLLEQVLRDFEPDVQTFLIETSILESFDANLADAVRDARDGRHALAALSHVDALVVPLNGERRWFRYHHLFADFLAERLLDDGGKRAAQLHTRAAAYFSAAGDLLQAVKHAHRSGNIAAAIEYVGQAGGWEMVLHRGIGFTRGILALFSQAEIESAPLLLRMQGYLFMKLGEMGKARQCIEMADARGDSRGTRDSAIVGALLRTYADDVHDPNWAPVLAARIGQLAQNDYLGRGTLHAAAAVGALAAGEFPTAERESRAGMAAMEMAGSVLGATYCRFHLAQSFFYRGRVGEAEACFRTALVAAEENYGSDSALKAVGNSLLGHLLYWRGEFDEARTRIESALDAIESHDSWFDILSVAYRAAAGLAWQDGGLKAACAILDRAETTARMRGLPEFLELIDAWRLEMLVGAGDNEAAMRLMSDRQLEGRLRGASSVFDWRRRMALGLAIAQFRLRADQSGEALKILQPLRDLCAAENRALDGARVGVLRAAAFRQRGDSGASMEALTPTLVYAAKENVPGVVTGLAIDVDPLLNAALRASGAAALPETLRSYVRRLRQSLRAQSAEGVETLSSRELAVLGQLCIGRSNKAIGRHLDLSENTVKFHLKRVYEKLGTNTRSGAVTAAVQRGLIRIQ